MLKSIEEFASYVHKKTGNLYTRHVCNTCFREQNNLYKKSIKPKVCLVCNETKLHTEFYNLKSLHPNDKRHNICKVCTRKYESEKRKKKYNKREENGEPVHWRPNTYNSPEQKDLAFELMTSLGFIFNEETGRWHKEGFKNPDGTFVRIQEKKRLEKERKLNEIKDMDIWNKITYLREQGFTLHQISDEIGINHTAVYKFLYNGKKVKLRN